MKLLADENFPGDAVAELQTKGHDVLWVHTDAPGSTDAQVLAKAASEARILITFDKDFGELAFRKALPASSGIILFRLSPISPRRIAQIAVTVLESRTDWAGHFSVIEANVVRMTPLPPEDPSDQGENNG